VINVINSKMKPAGKRILIIGGGVGGLVTGIYAQKAGFDSVIFEKNAYPGGECTGWDRNGYHIDGCIHWLAGTGEGRELNRLWKETGALENVEIYQPDSLITVFGGEQTLTFWRDRERLRMHLLEIAPEDSDMIEDMLRVAAAFENFEPTVDKPRDIMNPLEKIKFIYKNRRVFGKIGKFSQVSVREYKNRFNNELIKTALGYIVPDDYSAHNLFFTLASFLSNNAGVPRGGSKAFSRRLAQKYSETGGEIVLSSRVSEIIIRNNRAIGIRTSDGLEYFADYIVTACDPDVVFTNLLKGEYLDDEFQKRYDDRGSYPFQTCVYVACGIEGDLSGFPRNTVFNAGPVIFEDRVIETLSMKHFCHEPSFSPEGKSLVAVYFNASYDWWKELQTDPARYRSEKSRLGVDISVQLAKRFPGILKNPRLLDVATPLTYERYCGAHRGSWLSFGSTPRSQPFKHNGRIAALDNLYMTGQWLMPPGGLPGAAITGKWTIARILAGR
jgi:phytoene desaturase